MAFPVQQDANHMPALLQSIIDTAIDGIIVMDVSGKIVLSNAAADRLFGYAQEEMTGRDITT
jgi:PAS domain S-box-containing protein